MTRDAQLPATDFVQLVLRALPGESDSTLLRVLLQQVGTAAQLYTAPAHREEVLEELVTGLRRCAREAVPGSDAQLQLVTAWAALAESEDDVAVLRGLLSGEQTLEGLTVDQDMRWALLTALAGAGAAEEAEIVAERERDRTATGQEKAARALAARPTPEAKDRAWSQAVTGTELSNAMVAATALGFGTVHDPSLLLPFVTRYFETVESVWAQRTHHIAEQITTGFYPLPLADERLLEATQEWLTAHPTAHSGLRRTVSEHRDAVRRALAAQQADLSR